ncbi:MAG: 4-alpha-glucanotransferase [bacterium]|nr:4-alpha-glucanotransferase [bacterium]
MKFPRSAGVLLHPSCLPSPYGVGDLGPQAMAYVDWLADAGAMWWQVLPLHPPGPGDSPYSAVSTFAGSDLLISPDLLVKDGLLSGDEVVASADFKEHSVDFQRIGTWKRDLLWKAFERSQESPPTGLETKLNTFRKKHEWWLADFAQFATLKSAHGGADSRSWPAPLAMRRPEALRNWVRDHSREIDFVVFGQYLFFEQLERLRQHAHSRGVQLLGDVPIFVALDSADVWANPQIFLLDKQRRPTVVAGVPPDYFSKEGQLWGNPLYDWDRLRENGYDWWVKRLRHELEMVDAVRLDHFRGFVAHWEVEASEKTAITGQWAPGPGEELFRVAREKLGELPFVAEDLGFITEDVNALRCELGFPGMSVLHFAFSPHDRSIYVPYRHEPDQVVYTGTHDNNTTLGWYLEDATPEEQEYVRRYVGTDGSQINWDLIRVAMGSVADLAIVPHQDLAGLGADCRMNTPGRAEGNWRFRIAPWMLEDKIKHRLADLVWTYGRWPQDR